VPGGDNEIKEEIRSLMEDVAEFRPFLTRHQRNIIDEAALILRDNDYAEQVDVEEEGIEDDVAQESQPKSSLLARQSFLNKSKITEFSSPTENTVSNQLQLRGHG